MYKSNILNYILRSPALFPRASPLLIDILSHLLQYDPALRLTAINARRHPYFRKFFNDSPVITPCVLPPIEFFFESTVPSIDQLRDELLLEGKYCKILYIYALFIK